MGFLVFCNTQQLKHRAG